MGPLEFLKKIRDIGVPEDMRPEEARSVRAINLGIYFLVIAFLPSWMIVSSLKAHYAHLALEIVMEILALFIFLFNHRGQYLLARIYGCLLVNVVVMGMSVLSGDAVILHYFFIVAAGLSVFFPRGETKIAILMVVLSFICFNLALFLHHRISAFVIYSDTHRLLVNRGVEYTLFLAIVMIMLVTRYFVINADEQINQEKERVTRLSDKLKLFLPQQFVDSLVHGEADVMLDFRRRRLTIFFSDVQGFTRWTDKLEPEEVRGILNHYLSEVSAIAHKWGGTIDKFIGDALMIFFGDPEHTDDKDHALRCVKMALEMQEKMGELRKKWEGMGYDEALRIRIGINTGYATVGNFGSEERLNYTALGSAVNLASRLEAASAPDKITISHTTYLLVKDEIDFEPKGEIEVKGFSEPVKIYEVVGVK